MYEGHYYVFPEWNCVTLVLLITIMNGEGFKYPLYAIALPYHGTDYGIKRPQAVDQNSWQNFSLINATEASSSSDLCRHSIER
jgi:hypothetical protein